METWVIVLFVYILLKTENYFCTIKRQKDSYIQSSPFLVFSRMVTIRVQRVSAPVKRSRFWTPPLKIIFIRQHLSFSMTPKKFWKWTLCEMGWCLDTWESKNNNPFYIKCHPCFGEGYLIRNYIKRITAAADFSL